MFPTFGPNAGRTGHFDAAAFVERCALRVRAADMRQQHLQLRTPASLNAAVRIPTEAEASKHWGRSRTYVQGGGRDYAGVETAAQPARGGGACGPYSVR